jgi:hypothetical protein
VGSLGLPTFYSSSQRKLEALYNRGAGHPVSWLHEVTGSQLDQLRCCKAPRWDDGGAMSKIATAWIALNFVDLIKQKTQSWHQS